MTKRLIAVCLLLSTALFGIGCSSADPTADAPPKGAAPEVKPPDPGMLPPEQRGTGAKPSEGPDGGM